MRGESRKVGREGGADTQSCKVNKVDRNIGICNTMANRLIHMFAFASVGLRR